MKRIQRACAILFSLLAVAVYCEPAQAVVTPAGKDHLRIHTGMPKRHSDSLFAYTVEWRKDGGELYRSTGISFLNANKLDPQQPILITKKIVTAMKDGLIPLDPGWRGLTINQPQDQTELTLANKQGFSFTNIIVRDYSNQEISFDNNGASFNHDHIDVALDVVFSADVEYLDGFSSKKSQRASQGEIIVTIDQHEPVHIKTDGKTSQEIEQELAKHINGAKFGDKPLFPMLTNLDTRNNKPFDGGEVDLLNSAVKTIKLDVTDPSLGVLSKFKYPDDNNEVEVLEPRFMMAIFGIATVVVIGFLGWRNRKKLA